MRTTWWAGSGLALVLVAAGAAGAQAPRAPDGKPDLSGIWRSANDRHLVNLAPDAAQIPLQPWAAALYKERQASRGKGRPSERCLPRGIPGAMLVRDSPWKLVQAPGAVIVLFDELLHYRQIFTDGRPFPGDPTPTWFGYSIGRWDGDVLVVETRGFNDQTWLDEGGHPHTEALRVTERFGRRDAARMDVDITIDDPKAYTRSFTTTVRFERVPAADLGEHVCPVAPAS